MKLIANQQTELKISDNNTIAVTMLNANCELVQSNRIAKEDKKNTSSFNREVDIHSSVCQKLTKAGFNLLGKPLKFLNIQIDKSSSRNKVDSQLGKSAKIELNRRPYSNEIILELDPNNGEILRWHFPIVQRTENNVKKKIVKSTKKSNLQNSGSKVIFEIPLEPFDAIDNEVGEQKIAFKPLNKFFQLVSFKVVEYISNRIIKNTAKLIDQKLSKDDCLWKVGVDGTLSKAHPFELKKMQGKRVLLLVHGILSSATGAFSGLLNTANIESEAGNFFKSTQHLYQDNYIAYEHWTLSKNISKNAEQLLKKLPSNTTIDIVCHSRGAGVVRVLLENSKLTKKISKKGIKFNRVCFVAGACTGSPLASKGTVDRLFQVIHVFGLLTKVGGFSASVVVTILKGLIRGAQQMPGAASMDPEGREMKLLKKSEKTEANFYYYARANFDSAKWYLSPAEKTIIDSVGFNKLANDVVVPFEGAGPDAGYLNDYQKVHKECFFSEVDKDTSQSLYWHINFFKNAGFRDKLIACLKS